MEETLSRLRVQLELMDWPNVYFYKFIVPNETELVEKVRSLFDDTSEITFNPSKNGKFMSVSIKEVAIDVDSILEKYRQAATIKGIISL
jgi:putative lipoic acid-binding regulatory protein